MMAVLASTSGVTEAARQTAAERKVFIWYEDKLSELEGNSPL
jgi:HJR/Mrr/RecB family endonuclease